MIVPSELELLNLPDLLLRMGLAVLSGAAVGMNRNLHGKAAGLRTNAIVALGSSLVVIIGLHLEHGLLAQNQSVEYNAMSRIIQGILQGIGFLGAGVILHSESGKKVHGLTTAASVWLSAMLGVACGLACWHPLMVALFLTLLILVFGGPLERFVNRQFGSSSED